MAEGREKAADEIFCRSCGEPIKRAAEICPHCGVRNRKAGTTAQRGGQRTGTSSSGHDPTHYHTTVSANWWYVIAAGIGIWSFLLVLSSVVPNGTSDLVGLLAMAAWIGLPVAAYFDMQYVRANGNWNPNTVIWVVLLAIGIVNLFAGAVYLYRRHEVLGVP